MRKILAPLLAVVAWSVFLTPAEALTVRVQSTNGAPRIVVNGQPVRARMFWGAPGSTPLKINSETREISFEFIAADSATTGTMHFRFGNQPGTVTLDDIRIVDLEAVPDSKRDVLPGRNFEDGPASFTREWNIWPPPAQNTVGAVEVVPGTGRDNSAGLRVQIKAPADGNWPDFHIYHNADLPLIEGHRYRASFWAKANASRDLIVAFYRPGTTYTHLGGPQSAYENQIKLAAQAGVNFVSFPVALPWPEPGQQPDWSSVDTACRQVLRANPKALLIPRIPMDPPSWWCKTNPDEVMMWEDGPHGNYGVPASPVYRRDASARLMQLIQHLEEKFGDSIAGYHPGGQNTAEWFYEGTWKQPLNGYAPADLKAWREWLKARYRSDAALQNAWKKPDATRDSATVPTPQERHAAPNGVFRDPQTEGHLIDWAEFQQDAMAGCVKELARTARLGSRGQKLVLFFYGYGFEFGPVANGPATSGHYALRQVLNSPDIDILCSPISYFDRALGGSAPAMSAAESVALVGKMWLCEDDTHTYLATGDQPGSTDHVTTLEDTNKQLIRNVAHESMRNFGTWWMDLGATGWFNDPGMWREMTRLNALDETLLKNPTPFRPEVAAIIDEKAMLRLSSGSNAASAPGIYEARRALGRMGAPYGQYLLDDVLPLGLMSDGNRTSLPAKLFILLNTWTSGTLYNGRTTLINEAQLLKTSLRGTTKVWCYAPGMFGADKAPSRAARELTGFDLQPVTPAQAWATPTEVGRRLGLTQAFGVQRPIKPLFAARDATPQETLATYPDGSPAIALRRTKDGPSIFVGVPGLTSELLRIAAREAGVHLFTQTDCNVYANADFLSLHAAQDGQLEINTGKPGPVYDMLSGEQIGAGPKLTLPMQRGDSRVLRYGAK